MKKAIILTILFILLAASGFCAYLILTERMLVRSPVLMRNIPKINFVFGDVKYRNSAKEKWDTAVVGRELSIGSEIKTAESSFADIGFHKGTTIRISEKSSFKIDKLTVQKLSLEVTMGAIYGMFEKLFKSHSISVKTPTVVMAIRGTDLGIEVNEVKEENNKDDKKDKSKKKVEEDTVQDEVKEKKVMSTVYSLSGITEVYNPKFIKKKVLLAYQKKLKISEDEAPENPEELTQDEVLTLRGILNSIHTEEVLLISDKINFKLGSAKILEQSYPELDKIANIVKERGARIRIEGHTDDIGDAAANQALSVKRATSIMEYFIKKGIQKENLQIAGFGESKPLADNKTEKGRASNRRVEFIVIE